MTGMSADKIALEPGQPDYELARAIWMAEYDATAKSFDRLLVWLRRSRVERAAKIIATLEKQHYVVMHEDNIDGG